MSRNVSYNEQTVDTPNAIARFAHRKRIRASVELAAEYAPQNGNLADFGAENGHFLSMLRSLRGDLKLSAIEPYMSMDEVVGDDLERVEALAELQPNSQDVVTAWEVCEHLHFEELRAFIADSRAALNAGVGGAVDLGAHHVWLGGRVEGGQPDAAVQAALGIHTLGNIEGIGRRASGTPAEPQGYTQGFRCAVARGGGL